MHTLPDEAEGALNTATTPATPGRLLGTVLPSAPGAGAAAPFMPPLPSCPPAHRPLDGVVSTGEEPSSSGGGTSHRDSGRYHPCRLIYSFHGGASPSQFPDSSGDVEEEEEQGNDEEGCVRMAQELWWLDTLGKRDLSFGWVRPAASRRRRTSGPLRNPNAATAQPNNGTHNHSSSSTRPLVIGPSSARPDPLAATGDSTTRKRPWPDTLSAGGGGASAAVSSSSSPPENAAAAAPGTAVPSSFPPRPPVFKRRRQISDGDADDRHSIDAGRPCSVVEFHTFVLTATDTSTTAGPAVAGGGAPAPRGGGAWPSPWSNGAVGHKFGKSDESLSNGRSLNDSDDDDDDDDSSSDDTDSYDSSDDDDSSSDDTSYVSELTEPNFFAAATAWPSDFGGGVGGGADPERWGDDDDDEEGGAGGVGRGASDAALRVFAVVSTVVIAVDHAWSALSGAFRSNTPSAKAA